MASAERFRWNGSTSGLLGYLRRQMGSLRFASPKGPAFSLQIIGYESPTPCGDYWDENWLLIRVDAKHSSGAWAFTDPCLLTFEVQKLADWLDEVSKGKPRAATLDFVEPNLTFRFLDSPVPMLRIYFELEARPSWARKVTKEDFWLELEISELDLPNASNALRSGLKRFPERRAGSKQPVPRSGGTSGHRRH